MVMSPRLQQNLQVWHLIVGLGVTIIGGVVTATAAYAGLQYDAESAKRQLADLEEAKKELERSVSRIDRNIIRLGSKLSVTMEDPN